MNAADRLKLFLIKVQKPADDAGGCWLWTGSRRRPNGYGSFWNGERVVAAHRYAYAVLVGTITDSMQVLHRCDNPPCVRPDHLFLGTNDDNVADKMAKGREAHVRGEDSGAAKLTDKAVRDIIEMRRQGAKQVDIAAAFGVDQTVISCVLAGKTWGHLSASDPSLSGYAKGDRVKGAKLCPESVRLIRSLRGEGMTHAEIGRQVGVNEASVRRVLAGQSWAHVV